MNKCTLLLFILTLLLSFGCSKPTEYYTNPQSAGYHEKMLGGICSHCGKQFTISGYQLHNVAKIKCYYCGKYSDTKQAAVKWVSVKRQIDEYQSQQIILGLIQGVSKGIESYNQSYSNSKSTVYQVSGCSSDYDCGIGKRCVKKPYSSSGVCMETVNEYGVPVYNLPETDSIGVNLDDGCMFDTDCPIGFHCDSKYKTCIKR